MKINESLFERAIMKELSVRIKQYRISSQMTQAQLADKAILSAKTVMRFEKGEDISLYSFIKMIKALGLENSLDIILPDPTERPSNYLNGYKPKQRYRKKSKTNTTKWKWGDEK